jgi:hypothetical protein
MSAFRLNTVAVRRKPFGEMCMSRSERTWPCEAQPLLLATTLHVLRVFCNFGSRMRATKRERVSACRTFRTEMNKWP